MTIQNLGERPVPAPVLAVSRPKSLDAPESTERSAFAKLLSSLGKEMQQGEQTVQSALAAGRAGQDIGPTQLLALQAGVYRYGEAVDLAAKLVDRASTGVKTVIQGQ